MKNRIERFKSTWEISRNWQLIYPFLGALSTYYLGYRLGTKLVQTSTALQLLMGLALGHLALKFCVFSIRKLEAKWKVQQRWELIRIFIIFAITGSSSVFVGRPIIKMLGVSVENLGAVLYWIIFVVVSLIFYQILLVFWGFVLGQFTFFWNFEKKMLRRFGLGRFLDK
ncbi:MAG: hypothetical protein P8H23_06755 [Flavobacteriaceae bacterium]|nr:hypothetical protein [Flavobacteriaceae bacterium]